MCSVWNIGYLHKSLANFIALFCLATMSYNKKKLADSLRRVFLFTEYDLPNAHEKAKLLILGGANSEVIITPKGGLPLQGKVPPDAPPTLYVYNDGFDAIGEIVSELMRDNELECYVGKEAALKKIQQVIVDNKDKINANTNYEDIVKLQIIKMLRSEIQEWEVCVPVVNLSLEKAIRIGEVDFISKQEGYIENVELVMNHQGSSDQTKRISDKAALLSIVSNASSKATSWAKTRLRSHESLLSTRAVSKIEASINVIRAFVHIFYPPKLRSSFGLPFDVFGAETVIIGKTNDGSFVFQWDNRGALAPVEINNSKLNILRNDCCFSELSHMCSIPEENRTSIQRAILVSNHWLGRSITALTREDAFTSCTVAIERILILDDEETTVDKFSERLSYLLSTKLAERQIIHKIAKRLYNIRSKILHAGLMGVTEGELNEIENLAISALIASIRVTKEMDEHKLLRDWFNRQKFS